MKTFRFIVFFVLFFILTACFKDETATDILSQYKQNDSIKTILESVYIYKLINQDKKQEHALYVNTDEISVSNDSLYMKKLSRIEMLKAEIFSDLKMKDSARIWFTAALILSDAPKDKAEIYNKLGLLADKTDSITAKEYFQKSLDIYPNGTAKKNLLKINLCESDSTVAEIILKQDLLIDSLIFENKKLALLQDKKNHNSNSAFWIAVLLLGVIIFGVIKNLTDKKKIKKLEKQLKEETQKNLNFKNSGEILYNHVVNNKPIAKWTTADMVNFIEYYRIINPDFVEDLDNNYNKLSPRYKIILILEDMKKSIDEIKIIMSFEETSYYSAKSRINGAKK